MGDCKHCENKDTTISALTFNKASNDAYYFRAKEEIAESKEIMKRYTLALLYDDTDELKIKLIRETLQWMKKIKNN